MSGTHAVVVLAAGGSRRLGRPKQLLTRAGETLVHRTVRLASETSPRRLWVVTGAYRDEIQTALAGMDCEFLFNEDWATGLASSLQTAAAVLTAHTGPVLIAGCDQPALESVHLSRLLSGAEAAGCAATSHGGMPGIPAVVPAAIMRVANELSGDRGFGERLRRLPPEALMTMRADELALDIDDQEDLRIAVQRGLIDDPAQAGS
ncbi:MAG TPA: nucleotidyltransferase family protein [Luteimonas sp.]|nr:nucleotidyltransferase family protein [Luteimonas sp.]